jgi:hypothetical protein
VQSALQPSTEYGAAAALAAHFAVGKPEYPVAHATLVTENEVYFKLTVTFFEKSYPVFAVSSVQDGQHPAAEYAMFALEHTTA